MAKKTTKKTTKKKSRTPVSRRTAWHVHFGGEIASTVLAPALKLLVASSTDAASAPTTAQLHSIFETAHSCSIPRDLFDEVCTIAGIVFRRGLSVLTPLQQVSTPAHAFIHRMGQTVPAPLTDGNGADAIVAPEPELEGGKDDFKITNDDQPSSPRADVSDLLSLHTAIEEAQGIDPQPIIIPRR